MQRIDKLLVDRGLVKSRDVARRLIMAGKVRACGKVVQKPHTQVKEEAEILLEHKSEFVSRGGFKLRKVLEEFKIDAANRICMDIGASTGGFTDCLLKSGAKKIYAVDVGKGLLDYTLQNDAKIINIEKTNARYLDSGIIPEKIEIAVMDVSFISVTKIIPAVLDLITDDGIMAILIKPQFESERKDVGKGGIVKDPDIHIKVLKKLRDFFADLGIRINGLTFSPIKGRKGNIEYFFVLGKGSAGNYNEDIKNVVERAFSEAIRL